MALPIVTRRSGRHAAIVRGGDARKRMWVAPLAVEGASGLLHVLMLHAAGPKSTGLGQRSLAFGQLGGARRWVRRFQRRSITCRRRHGQLGSCRLLRLLRVLCALAFLSQLSSHQVDEACQLSGPQSSQLAARDRAPLPAKGQAGTACGEEQGGGGGEARVVEQVLQKDLSEG